MIAAAASTRFSEALTFAVEIGDPCYEALALRGLGLVRAPVNADAAIRLLIDGLTCCRRYQDVYPWVRAVILTDLVELQHGADTSGARRGERDWPRSARSPTSPNALRPIVVDPLRSSQDAFPQQTPFQTVAT